MKKVNPQDLNSLVIRAQKGDADALGTIIELTENRLYKFCLYLTGNAQISQDLCQDTFIKILENIKKIEKPERLMSWMFTTAKNLYFDFRRLSANKVLPLDPDFDISDESHALQQYDTSIELKKALSFLTEEERFVILLIDLEEYSYLEAANIMGISENALRSRIFRARQSLLDKIETLRNELKSQDVYKGEGVQS